MPTEMAQQLQEIRSIFQLLFQQFDLLAKFIKPRLQLLSILGRKLRAGGGEKFRESRRRQNQNQRQESKVHALVLSRRADSVKQSSLHR